MTRAQAERMREQVRSMLNTVAMDENASKVEEALEEVELELDYFLAESSHGIVGGP